MKYGLTKIAGALLAAGFALNAQAADITIAYASDPISMDIHEQLSGGMMQFSHMSFDPLVRWTQDLQFESRLAEKWERIDPLTMRFHLRKGVKFHSGNDFTAKDIAWTLDRLKSSTDYKGLFEVFGSAKIVDDYTIDLVTTKPYPLLLPMATYIFAMDSKFYTGVDENNKDKAAVIKFGNTFASGHLSGTGPFVVKSREQGIKWEFERFDGYWDKQSPGNVDKLTLVAIKEDATRVAALLSSDVDMISPVAPNDHQRVKDAKNLELVTLPGTRIITFQMNQKSNPALQDVRVRQAIVHAINNKGIAKKIMKDFATVASQQSPAGYLGHVPELEVRYDLKRAKALMKEAGYEKGFKLSMIAPSDRYINDAKIAQAAASMLAKIGIKVDLKTMPKAQYWPEFDKCAADMLMIGWHADTEDSANFTEFLTMTRDEKTGMGQYNCGYYSNPAVDKLVNDANVETDTEKRAAMLKQVETTLYNDAAFVPLHWQNLSWGANKKLDMKPVINVMEFPYLGDLVVAE
ncbi:ABC transporter substrate-binding protein [Motilimonas sp. E26]|uniref:ABC transporter substrate-binding protein n=1 Tax=Motilimonas sp. E26 TaxID=2865674 RepID=UPI001E4C44C3|nr:ABC transporter substrate-binding protein [Motilimonas sp. E26]MCE0556398.1 ABC transporter substrate-binding protein [Motilimonas sp. E26]